VARWLDRSVVLTKRDATANHCAALSKAVAGNRVGVLLWFDYRFGLTRDDVLEGLMPALAECKSVHVLRWLIARYAVTGDDFEVVGFYPFTVACEKGRVAVVEAMATEVLPQISDRKKVRDAIEMGLQAACMAGKTDVADWIRAKLMASAEYPEQMDETLRQCCTTGNLRSVAWIIATYNHLPSTTAIVGMLAASCVTGQIHVAEWLRSSFRLDARDMYDCYLLVSRLKKTPCNIDGMRWLLGGIARSSPPSISVEMTDTSPHTDCCFTRLASDVDRRGFEEVGGGGGGAEVVW